jgi:hypothetical protein
MAWPSAEQLLQPMALSQATGQGRGWSPPLHVDPLRQGGEVQVEEGPRVASHGVIYLGAPPFQQRGAMHGPGSRLLHSHRAL